MSQSNVDIEAVNSDWCSAGDGCSLKEVLREGPTISRRQEGSNDHVKFLRNPVHSGLPLELRVSRVQGLKRINVLSSARTLELSVQTASDPTPSYWCTLRGTACGDLFEASIDLEQHRNLEALHIRLLSLRQPGSCAIKDIFITKSGCHDAPELGWRENKTVEIMKDLTGCKNATSSSQLHTQDASASVLLRDGVGTEEPLHPAEAPESSARDDDDKRVTTVPHNPAPAYFSQAEQIRMLLQHALHGPSTQLPSTLDDLRLKMEAGNGEGSTQSNPMSSLVSSIAKMALGANHVTKGPTQPFTKDSTTGHSGSGNCGHPGPLAPAVQLEGMAMSIITSLHACLERIEKLEEVAQDRVRTLDHMIAKVSLLCDKVEVSRRASP